MFRQIPKSQPIKKKKPDRLDFIKTNSFLFLYFGNSTIKLPENKRLKCKSIYGRVVRIHCFNEHSGGTLKMYVVF